MYVDAEKKNLAKFNFLRERQSGSRGGADREGDRESQAGPNPPAQCLMQGSNS